MTSGGLAQRQLALNIQLRDDATLDNFLCAPSEEALMPALRAQLGPEGEPIIYLFGPDDTGKSHLLQACCHLAGSAALYLPLAELVSYPPDDVLQGIESMSLVCLDDVHSVLGNADWELALFHLINRARQSGCRLLLSGIAAPRVLAIDLPDLRSRLSWGVVYQLAAGEDESRQAIMVFRAGRRGLDMPAEVASYIVNRAPRSLSSLLQLLDQLDAASLAEKRSLSIPFVKAQLGW
ncbi:MAG: DnaA regulatory inactivator Hda [Halioglobus sp.]